MVIGYSILGPHENSVLCFGIRKFALVKYLTIAIGVSSILGFFIDLVIKSVNFHQYITYDVKDVSKSTVVMLYITYFLQVGYCAIQIGIAVVLLIGVFKKQSKWIKIWIGVATVMLIFFIIFTFLQIFTVFTFAEEHGHKAGMEHLFIFVAALCTQAICIYIVRLHYSYINIESITSHGADNNL